MQTSGIAPSSNPNVTSTGNTRGFNDLSGEDFFALLIAQLQAQDPMKPTDNQQLLSQMSSIREMEQSAKLNSTLDTLAAEQRFSATSGLIGHYISGTVKDSAGQPVEVQGLVIGVRYEHGKGILELHNGKSLPAEKVDQVTLIENLPPEILAQLQAELGQTPAPSPTDETPDPTDEDDGATDDVDPSGNGDEVDPAGKSISQPRLNVAFNPNSVRAAKTTQTVSVLESLLNTKVGISF